MGSKKQTKTGKKYEKQKARRRLAVYGILLIILLLAAAFAPVLTPYDPYEQDLSRALVAPCAKHLLGTDRYGRDLLSRVIMGGRTTIFSSLLLVFLIAVVGTAIGVAAGWCGGVTDTILMRLSDIFLAFPGLVFALAVASVLKGGMLHAVFSLAVVSWPKFARMARSQVLVIKEEPYIEAAKLAGSGTWKIIWKHILPNLMGTILITAVLDMGTMMMELAGLSFLGLGAAPPTAEWGAMMSNGRSMLQTAPWVILSPGCAIFLTVAVCNLCGDAVRDALERG